jgi:succinate dehydrogenase/fumarate reductase-like Fe-S protein
VPWVRHLVIAMGELKKALDGISVAIEDLTIEDDEDETEPVVSPLGWADGIDERSCVYCGWLSCKCGEQEAELDEMVNPESEQVADE